MRTHTDASFSFSFSFLVLVSRFSFCKLMVEAVLSVRGTNTNTNAALCVTQHFPASKQMPQPKAPAYSVSDASCTQSAPETGAPSFCARHAPIQHRSRGNSAAAAPTPKLLSVTQHLPASEHDDTPASSCLVSHTL
jgi:hypothetical protein